MARVRARRRGAVVDLTGIEARLLAGLADQLAPLLEGGPTGGVSADPVRDRLFPRAYLDPTEERADREWQELAHPGLVAEKAAALARLTTNLVDAGVGGIDDDAMLRVQLSADDAEVWVGALNDARLVSGVALGITDSFDPSALDPNDPAQVPFFVYDMLTYLQGALIEVIT